MKFLLLLALAFIVFSWLSRMKAQGTARGAARPQTEARDGEPMLRCAQCGVHFPASEALMQDGRAYCSEKHLPAHARR